MFVSLAVRVPAVSAEVLMSEAVLSVTVVLSARLPVQTVLGCLPSRVRQPRYDVEGIR